MSILSKIAKLKREQDEHSARIDAIKRKEEAVIRNRSDAMFNAFITALRELDCQTVLTHYVRVRGDKRAIILLIDGKPIVQFTPHHEFVPCHCESMCDCKDYKYEITVTPMGFWRQVAYDWDDTRSSFTIETISEREALNEDETAKSILRIIQDWEDNT